MRFAIVMVCGVMFGATPEVEITLAHGSKAEAGIREQLQRLLKTYDLADWVWTRKVVIEGGSIPHSHPVLTLHTREYGDDLQLSTFLHEEYHWYETAHEREVAAAVEELKAAYPKVPVGGLDGAQDEYSSYMHIVVCYVEWQKMKALVGAERARKAMEFWATDHYRAIYRLVLDHEAAVGDVVKRHGLLPRE